MMIGAIVVIMVMLITMVGVHDDGEDVFVMDDEGDHDGNDYEPSLWIRWVPNKRRRKIR